MSNPKEFNACIPMRSLQDIFTGADGRLLFYGREMVIYDEEQYGCVQVKISVTPVGQAKDVLPAPAGCK